MTCARITTGAVEPISVFAVSVAGTPLTGLTDLYVRVRRVSNGHFLDWNDMTFKAAAWTTLNKILTQVSATNAPGLYEVTGGLDTSAITNVTANDDYQVVPLQTPGTNARLPGPGVIQVGKWADRLDANVSTRATQAQILSDATPFPGTRVDAAISTRATQAQILSDATPFPGARIDAAVSSRATQAQILSDATPFAGANIALIQAKTTNLPTDPADESNQLAQHTATQAAIAALNNLSQAGVQSAMTAQGYTAARAPKLDALDANVSTRATPAQILSDATPFAGADIGLIKTAAQAVNTRLPSDPADESQVQAAIALVQADTTAILVDTADMQPRVVAIEADTNEAQLKLPTNNIMGSSVKADMDDEINAILADTAEMQPKLPTNNIMGSSVKTDKDDEIDAILTDTAAIEPLVTANLNATVGSRASEANATANKVAVIAEVDANEAKIDILQTTVNGLNDLSAAQVDAQLSGTHGAGAWGGTGLTPVQVSAAVWDANRASYGVAGSFGESVRVNAAGLQGDAVTEIRDGILNDGTRFSGALIARLDADVSSRAAPGAAMDLVAGALDSSSLDATAAAEIADAVWDEPMAGHTGAGTAGQLENRLDVAVSTRAAPGAQMDLVNDAVDSASLASSAAVEIAGKVWDEPLAGHAIPGSAGATEALLDVAVSSRATPGAQMALTAPTRAAVADEVWDELTAGHTAAGTTGKALLDAGAVSDPNVVAAAVWDKTAAAHTIPGSMGQLENRLDVTLSTRAAPGAPMNLATGAVTATAVDTTGANKIRDSILSDATRFQGARIDAAISSRAATGDAMDLVANAIDATAIDATGASELAGAVWDEPLAGHLAVGSAGKALNDGSNPGAIADAVWDEPLAGHVGAGSAGQAQGRLDVAVSTRAAPGAAMALVANAVDASSLALAGANKVRDTILSDATKFAGARIDAAITSRAAPGAQMDLVNDAVDAGSVAASGAQEVASAVWDEIMAGHAIVGTAGQLVHRLDANVSTRAAPGAQMGLTPAGVTAAVNGAWNEPIAGHLTPGTTGKALNDAGIAVSVPAIVAGVWDEPRAGHATPGTMGEAQEQSSTVAAQVEKIDQAATVAPSAAVPGSLLDRLTNKSGARTYDQSTDSLEGIRDRVG